MIELTDSEEKMARALHKDSIVLDIHSDIMLDVIRRRQAGKNAVYQNYLADGRLELSGSGLSTFGAEVLREMNRLGMIPDISHISYSGKDEILKLSDSPVIASHLAAKGVHDWPVNLSDQQIEELASTGGVIGIIFFSSAPSKDYATIDNVVDHIEYITDLVGIDYVCLGPNFYDYMIDDTLSTGMWLKDMDYSSIEFDKEVEDTTKMYNITKALVARGFTQKNIEKVLGENCLRVIAEVCG